MHEASLVRALMGKILRIAEAENAHRVTAVSVWIGALSHMSREHFREHYAIAAAGTIAEDAELDLSLSGDTGDSRAQDIVLLSIKVEDREPDRHFG